MSKARNAILGSLRQPHRVQTKGIKALNSVTTSAEMTAVCCPHRVTLAQPPALLPRANCSSAHPGEPYAHLLGHSPCVRKSLSRGRGSWKIARVFSQSPENVLGPADQDGRAVLVQHHLQPARVV